MSEEQARTPEIPSDMKAFNRRFVEDFRANGRRPAGPMAGRSILVLTTTGARSGEPRTVVLGYGREGDSYVVIASNNGAADHPAWYRNLLANPMAMVEAEGEEIRVRARTAEPGERPRLAARVPYLEGQQKLTQREIPLVVFEPVAG
jgi:deazaflavin-dependent oxidoreductase (nitroreductase family)